MQKQSITSIFGSIYVRFWIIIFLSIPLILLSIPETGIQFLQYSFQFEGEEIFIVVLSTLIYAICIWTFGPVALNEIIKWRPGISLLLIIISSTFYIYNLISVYILGTFPLIFDFSLVIDLMFLNYLEINRTYKNIQSTDYLSKRLPSNVHVKVGQEIKDVAISSLRKDDTVLVKDGELVPCDGCILEGESRVQEPFISGKNYRIQKKINDLILAGSTCIKGALTVRTINTDQNMYISKIMSIVDKNFSYHSKYQKKLDRKNIYLFIITFIAALAAFTVSFFIFKAGLTLSIERALTVLVSSCFFALYIVVPFVEMLSIRSLSEYGVLINSRDVLENIKNANTVIFDKTGTLTRESFGVNDIAVFNNKLTKDEIIKFAASVEHNFNNPISRAIMDFSEEILPAYNCKYIESKGVVGTVEGKNVGVVNQNYLIENNIRHDLRKFDELREGGRIVLFVIIESEVFGAVILSDAIRSEARNAIKQLKKLKIKTFVITADTKESAQWIAHELSLDDYIAEISKSEWSSKVNTLQQNGATVCATGDGCKDAEYLDKVNAGFAIGAGLNAGLMNSHIIQYARNPLDILKVIKVSKLNRKKISQNNFWIIIYTIATILITNGFLTKGIYFLTPATGALLSFLGTLVVIVNSKFYQYVK